MDIFDIHNVKVEKANAMLQHSQFRKIAKLFRLVELFLAVVIFSWISTRIPFVIRTFGDYFRQLLSVIVSPLFIFMISNVIVLTLVLKSGQITENQDDVDDSGGDLYDAIANNVGEDAPPVMKPEEIVYHDKRIVSEVNAKSVDDYCCHESEIEVNRSTKKPPSDSVSDLDRKVYRRSQSENLMKKACFPETEQLSGKLRRSETELLRREVDTPAEEINVVDDLSNEEFQKRIERFIARQIRFHHDEKLAIVAHV